MTTIVDLPIGTYFIFKEQMPFPSPFNENTLRKKINIDSYIIIGSKQYLNVKNYPVPIHQIRHLKIEQRYVIKL